MKEIPQHALDTLPEGYTILGWGGSFKYEVNRDFHRVIISDGDGWFNDEAEASWDLSDPDEFFAAPSDSDIVKLNKDKMMFKKVVFEGQHGQIDMDKLEQCKEWADRAIECINNAFCEEWHGESGQQIFPTDAEERKTYPVGTFIKDYFPHAIAALAHHSFVSQQQHGPASNGAPMEWLKDKSVGDGNQIVRHYMEGDYENMAWRALELLERQLTNTL